MGIVHARVTSVFGEKLYLAEFRYNNVPTPMNDGSNIFELYQPVIFESGASGTVKDYVFSDVKNIQVKKDGEKSEYALKGYKTATDEFSITFVLLDESGGVNPPEIEGNAQITANFTFGDSEASGSGTGLFVSYLAV